MHGLPAEAGRSTAAPSWQTAIAPLTGESGKTWAISAPCRWISLQANATTADDSEHQGRSRCVFSITNPWMRPANQPAAGGLPLPLPAAIITFADTTYRRMSGYSVENPTDGVIQVKPKFTDYYNLAYSKRGGVQLSVTQQLGRTATLYLSGSSPDLLGHHDDADERQAGLNAAVDDINWSLSYSLTKNAWQQGR